MKLSDFEIGKTFFGPGGFEWLCTDKGSRVVVAIMLEPYKASYWFEGPPYVVQEVVFGSEDFSSLYTDETQEIIKTMNEIDISSHPGFDSPDLFKMMKSERVNYPYKKLLKFDRVGKNGYVYHPYSAVKKEDIWFIKVFELFSKQYTEIEQEEFVQMPLSNERYLKIRKTSFNKSKV